MLVPVIGLARLGMPIMVPIGGPVFVAPFAFVMPHIVGGVVPLVARIAPAIVMAMLAVTTAVLVVIVSPSLVRAMSSGSVGVAPRMASVMARQSLRHARLDDHVGLGVLTNGRRDVRRGRMQFDVGGRGQRIGLRVGGNGQAQAEEERSGGDHANGVHAADP